MYNDGGSHTTFYFSSIILWEANIMYNDGGSHTSFYFSRLDRTHLRRYREYSQREIIRPGFTRLNLPYFMDDETLGFVLEAVKLVAEEGWKLLPQYMFNPETGEWRQVNFQVSVGTFNLLVRNWFSHPYQLDESTFIYRGIRSDFSFLFHFSMKFMSANIIAPDFLRCHIWGYSVCLCPIKRMPALYGL